MKQKTITDYEEELLDRVPAEDKIEVANTPRFILCADEINDLINLSVSDAPIELIEEFGPELYDILFTAIVKTAKFLEDRDV